MLLSIAKILLVVAVILTAIKLLWIKKTPWTLPIFVFVSSALIYIATLLPISISAKWEWELLVAVWIISLLTIIWKKGSTKAMIIATIAMILVLIGLAYYPTTTNTGPTQSTNENGMPKTTIEQRATVILAQAGWLPGWYSFDIDSSVITGEPGQGAFNEAGAKNPEEAISFLKKDLDSAKALRKSILDKSGATLNQLYDKNNWIAVQTLIDGWTYDGNTMFQNGDTVSAGAKAGQKGEIFLIFSPPDGKSAKMAALTYGSNADKEKAKVIEATKNDVSVRGPCQNIQESIPIPKPKPNPVPNNPTPKPQPKPEPEPTKPEPRVLESKDIRQDIQSNPMVDDWKKDVPGSYGDDRTVSDEDGSKVANGYQEEPEEDAEQAEKEAYDSSKAAKEKQDTAVDNAVDNGAGTSNDDNFDDDAGDVGSGDNAIDW